MALPVAESAQVAFNNLLLLGFDPEEVQKKFGVLVEVGMFIHAPGNLKAMEHIMHLLILKAYPSEAGQAFKLLWPIVDKTQSREFRKFVGEKLVAMQREKLIPTLPIVRATMIDQPFGLKYCTVLVHITTLIMRRQLSSWKQSVPVFPPFQPNYRERLIRLAKMRLQMEQENFFRLLEDASASEQQWKQFAVHWGSKYTTAVSERETISARLNQAKADNPISNLKLDESETAVKNMWHFVDTFEEQSREGRKAMDGIWLRKHEQPSIDLSRFAAEQHVDLRALGDRVDLESLLQRWAACISQLNRQLSQHPSGREGLDRLAAAAGKVTDVTQRNAQHLQRLRELRSRLEGEVSGLEAALPALRSNAHRTLLPASIAVPSVALHDVLLAPAPLLPSALPLHSEAAHRSPLSPLPELAASFRTDPSALPAPAHPPPPCRDDDNNENDDDDGLSDRLAMRFARGGGGGGGGGRDTGLPPSRLPAPKVSGAAAGGAPKGREISELDQRMLQMRRRLRDQAPPAIVPEPPLSPAPAEAEAGQARAGDGEAARPGLSVAVPSEAPLLLARAGQGDAQAGVDSAGRVAPVPEPEGAGPGRASGHHHDQDLFQVPSQGSRAQPEGHKRPVTTAARVTVTAAPPKGEEGGGDGGGMTEIERRRAALRAKLAGAREDGLPVPVPVPGPGAEASAAKGEGGKQRGERAVC